MKQIIALLIIPIILFSACSKKNKRPSIIYISGTVTDKTTSSPLNSVSVKLYQSGGIFGIPTVLKTYNTNSAGKFNFNYSPDDEFNYNYLEFSKTLYKERTVDLNEDLENQHFNIQLTK